ncbi:MAG TPA: aldehyde ferredoxin oxidoreductase family protein, partial [Anaerolineaceae bacterium]|nr:aldehyde ferredoxin oxidoreductase family protein [Anaerolineaceae bacterium]
MTTFTGRVLQVDLTGGSIERYQIDPEMLRKYIGGRGLGAYLAWSKIPPHVDPLSPDNRLMFLTGPLSGSPFPGTGKFVVVTRSPATGTFCDSHASGLLAPVLRFAGIDVLMLVGRAPEPSYLWIKDSQVEIRSAADLWGMDTFETETILRERHGHNDVGVATIGPAGEHLVKFAGINSDFYRQAARGGVGAVMGSKNLKAVVVRGTGSVPVAYPDRVIALQKVQADKLATSPGGQARVKYGTTSSFPLTNAASMLPTRNFQQGSFPEGVGKLDAEGFARLTIGVAGCYGCVMPCSRLIEAPYKSKKNRIEGPEYETIGLLGSNIGVSDPGCVAELNLLCDRLGLDTISTGVVISFAMECVERGIITDPTYADLRFGGEAAALRAVRDIAFREGLGDWMAEGVREFSRRLGEGSEHFAIHVKGLELPAYDPRAGFGTGLCYAVTARGGCHRRAWPPAREILGNVNPYTVENKAAMVKKTFNERAVLHSLVACDFHPDALPITMEEYSQFVTAATGEEYSLEELDQCAERIETTLRLFNDREGFTRADDTLPPRILKEAFTDGPAKGQLFGETGLNQMLDEYYALRGWDLQGKPLAETVARLGIPVQE